MAWWLDGHIKKGKRELNFSEFSAYAVGRQYKKLEEIGKQVEKGEMPLSSYTLIHRYAILNAQQKKLIEDWGNASMHILKQNNPPDSFLKRQ